jgi:hypothetical protein
MQLLTLGLELLSRCMQRGTLSRHHLCGAQWWCHMFKHACKHKGMK